MKISLTKERMAGFSEEEIERLQRLGIEVKRKNHPQKKRAISLSQKPYILTVYVSCRICSYINKTIYLMQQDEDVLISKEIDRIPDTLPSGMAIKESHYNVRCCINCTDYLMSLPKEEVIRKLLAAVNNYTLY